MEGDLISATARNEVLLDCSSLPPSEWGDLVSFLRTQPEIQGVLPVKFVTDAQPDPNLLSVVIPHVEFWVNMAKGAVTLIGAPLLKHVIEKWLETRKAKEHEWVPILGPDGRTVKMVPKDDPPRK